MRLIDADALSKKLCETTIFIKGGEAFQRMINNATTIDAEPIVRCKECMYFKKWIIDFTGDTIELNSCSYNNHGMNEDGYCSRGKRKEP